MEKLIEIISYTHSEGTVYFKYLGTTTRNCRVWLHWKNFTLHFVDLTFEENLNVEYFVGFNNSVVDGLQNFVVSFIFDSHVEDHSIKIGDKVKDFDFLDEFRTKLEDPSYYSFDEVFIKKIYEDKLIRINEGDIVVDIGANYGLFSIYAHTFKPSKIISFEPSKVTFNFLSKNFKNGVLLQNAISDTSGFKHFKDNPISTSASKIVEDFGDYQVEVIGINDLHNHLGLERIDYLKIDCEGSEKNIFDGISHHTMYKINKIVVEFHSQEIKELIISKLDHFGFVIHKVTDELIFSYNPNYYKNKKKIALVSTYCDTEEKKIIFLDLVKKVKSLGIDVMAISSLHLDKEIIEACDYLFYTKENPILSWPLRLFTFWKEMQLPDGRITTMHRGVGDYGWAALYHVKKLTQIAMTYDYDIFYHMIYDLEIDDVVENAIKNFEGNIVYPRRDPNHPETLWETTLHFMSFDKDLMREIEKEITIDSYLSTNGVAEGEVLKWKNKFNISGSEHPVKDKIFYWKDYDFFDYSPTKDFKLFISKNPEIEIWLGEDPPVPAKLSPNLKLVFYDFQFLGKISVVVNEKIYDLTDKINPFEIIELPIDTGKIYSFTLEHRGNKYELKDKFDEIMLNQVYYNYR